MSLEITMPQLSDTMTEGKVIKWLKKEGDKVSTGDKVAEVETDKAVMEMESFAAGTLAAVLAKEGEKVAVGAVLAVVATGKEDPAEVKKQAISKGAAPSKSAAAPPPQVAPVATWAEASSGEIHEADGAGHTTARSQSAGTAVAAPSEPSRAAMATGAFESPP